MTETVENMEIAYLSQNAPGELECGDACVVVRRDPRVLLAVADGEGHGERAAAASRRFCQYVQANAALSLEEILQGAHRAQGRVRGVAVAMMDVDLESGRMTFAGVGNIEVQAHSREVIRPVCSRGMLGRQMRRLVSQEYRLYKGDLVVVYSDGVSSRLDLASYKDLDPDQIVKSILENHAKGYDDAICLAFRY